MTNRDMREAVTEYWLAHYMSAAGVCCLCGNSGIIDTRATAYSPKGEPVGRPDFCICPNGQTIREQAPRPLAGKTHAPAAKHARVKREG